MSAWRIHHHRHDPVHAVQATAQTRRADMFALAEGTWPGPAAADPIATIYLGGAESGHFSPRGTGRTRTVGVAVSNSMALPKTPKKNR
jgi:hypothetical protein